MTSNHRLSSQKSRWVFTYNNFDHNINYKNHFRNGDFNIKRCVWGYEKSPVNETPHIQGYAEFQRSVRLGFVRRILPNAHWEGATGSAKANYQYCTKGQDYEIIGNFSKEACGQSDEVKLHSSHIVRGLLNDQTALQTMLSKEYAHQHIYFDKIVRKIREVEMKRSLYEEWGTKLLRVWQYAILKRVMAQNDRKVTWLFDARAKERAFFANYISIMYDFQLFDGQLSCRDLAGVLNINASGICLDVCRAAESTLDYSAIECLKNGCMKYFGKCLRFKPMKLVVLANFYPDRHQLSDDRWDILTFGEGILDNVDECALIMPVQDQYPFVSPPPACDLSTGFNLRQFLLTKGIIEANAGESELTLQSSSSSSHNGK